jgi:hypothetical protein
MLPGFVPLIPAFGAHPVSGTFETAYEFHTFGFAEKMLWTDMDGQDIEELTLNENVTLVIKNRTNPKDTIKITASNPYTNYSFVIDIDFHKDRNDDNDPEYLWIGIICIAGVMIIGIIIVFCRQSSEKHHHHQPDDLKETLITQEPDRDQDGINRSSVDPGSIRGSIDPILSAPAAVALAATGQEPLPEGSLVR